MTSRRADKISFWVSVVWASIAVAILGFQLAAADIPISVLVFTLITSWIGIYASLDHLYTVARRAREVSR